MKMILTLAFLAAFNLAAFSQDAQGTEIKTKSQDQTYSYAYISIQGKLFSKKLNVEVDLGDTPEQMEAGKEYSKILTNKKSFASILNYMAERGFELVDTVDFVYTAQGTGGSTGIVYIMRKSN